jgi:hypothetical protein
MEAKIIVKLKISILGFTALMNATKTIMSKIIAY